MEYHVQKCMNGWLISAWDNFKSTQELFVATDIDELPKIIREYEEKLVKTQAKNAGNSGGLRNDPMGYLVKEAAGMNLQNKQARISDVRIGEYHKLG